MADAAVRFRSSIAPACPTCSAVSCPSLYPWHLVAMEQVPSLGGLSVIFVVFCLVRKQKWAMKMRTKAPRPWRNYGWITRIPSRSCHRGAAEIRTVRGRLSGEAEVKWNSSVGKRSDFLAAASSPKPCCETCLRNLELWCWWVTPMDPLSKVFECIWVMQTFNLGSIHAKAWLVLEHSSLQGIKAMRINHDYFSAKFITEK